jgi:hypothetical protein
MQASNIVIFIEVEMEAVRLSCWIMILDVSSFVSERSSSCMFLEHYIHVYSSAEANDFTDFADGVVCFD